MCAPYFVNLNNNTSVKKAIILCSFTFTAKENRKSYRIYNYLFEVFRAPVKSVEWIGESGVDSPGSVP